MTDRPILFSGPMVRAILDGRKTQTRRPMKTPPTIPFSTACRDAAGIYTSDEWGNQLERLRVPHAPGDRLWVREAWAFEVNAIGSMRDEEGPFVYGADQGSERYRLHPKWTPSIHMPRWASRLTLIVTDVRVQRLQDISGADAIAEGITDGWSDGMHGYLIYEQGQCGEIPYPRYTASPVASYASLWDACYGSGAWDANPWVAATTFTTHHCNIDQMESGE